MFGEPSLLTLKFGSVFGVVNVRTAGWNCWSCRSDSREPSAIVADMKSRSGVLRVERGAVSGSLVQVVVTVAGVATEAVGVRRA